jgi:3-oxoacyl-[acyl-carrier protein] reductase
MKRQRSGKIITVSSVAGTAPSADGGYAHYGAAKAAIAHYTRYLAQDLGLFGITANCIAPGGSPPGGSCRPSFRAAARATAIEPSWSPFGGSGRSRIAKVVEFLGSDLSDYVTGAVIPIDGGLVRG